MQITSHPLSEILVKNTFIQMTEASPPTGQVGYNCLDPKCTTDKFGNLLSTEKISRPRIESCDAVLYSTPLSSSSVDTININMSHIVGTDSKNKPNGTSANYDDQPSPSEKRPTIVLTNIPETIFDDDDYSPASRGQPDQNSPSFFSGGPDSPHRGYVLDGVIIQQNGQQFYPSKGVDFPRGADSSETVATVSATPGFVGGWPQSDFDEQNMECFSSAGKSIGQCSDNNNILSDGLLSSIDADSSHLKYIADNEQKNHSNYYFNNNENNNNNDNLSTPQNGKEDDIWINEEAPHLPSVGHNKTTIMLRNIPNKYSQKMVLDAINQNFEGLYDFFYLPIDFRNKCNVGYAFINFISPYYAESFKQKFVGVKLNAFKSRKICEVSWGRVQGLQANIEHYRNSAVMSIPNELYRPLLMRNGICLPFPAPNAAVPSVKLRPQKQM